MCWKIYLYGIGTVLVLVIQKGRNSNTDNIRSPILKYYLYQNKIRVQLYYTRRYMMII